MEIVTNYLVPTSGQPPLAAKPAKDDGSDTFAGLLAALSGVISLLTPAAPPDAAASQAGSGLQAMGTSGLAAGASPDPYGQPAGSLSPAAGPALSAPAGTLTGAGLSPAAVSDDPSVAGGVVASVGDGVIAAGSLPASGKVATPAVQWAQALPSPAVAPDNAAQTVLQGSSPLATPVQPSGSPPGVRKAAVSGSGVAPSGGYLPEVGAVVSNPAAAQTSVPGTPGVAASQASAGGLGAVVPGGAAQAVPGVQAAAPAGSGPVSVSAPAPVQPQAAAGQPEPVVQGAGPGYHPEAGVALATPAVLATAARGPVQGQVAPATGGGTTSPAPVGLPGTTAASSGQFAPDGGTGSSGGKGSDPGKNPVTSPLAGSPVPVFQPPTGTPAVSVANLPQQAAQSILSYLNQGGRVPAQLQLQLDPPALGKLIVHLAMEAGTLSVTFLTASSHARDAVAASLPQMRELLGQNNFVLGHTGVYVGSQTGGQQGASGNPGGQPQQGPAIRFLAPVAAGEEGIQSQLQSGSSLLNILV